MRQSHVLFIRIEAKKNVFIGSSTSCPGPSLASICLAVIGFMNCFCSAKNFLTRTLTPSLSRLWIRCTKVWRRFRIRSHLKNGWLRMKWSFAYIGVSLLFSFPSSPYFSVMFAFSTICLKGSRSTWTLCFYRRSFVTMNTYVITSSPSFDMEIGLAVMLKKWISDLIWQSLIGNPWSI